MVWGFRERKRVLWSCRVCQWGVCVCLYMFSMVMMVMMMMMVVLNYGHPASMLFVVIAYPRYSNSDENSNIQQY